MDIKKFEAEYIYDYDLDVVNIEVKQDYTHDKSIDLGFGIFLDFDKNQLPVNLEIVSASKIMGIDKKCLVNPDGNVTITIKKDIIEVEIVFKLKKETESMQFTGLNQYKFPISESSFAII